MDTSLKWASRVGPFVSLPLLVWLSIRWRHSASDPKGVSVPSRFLPCSCEFPVLKKNDFFHVLANWKMFHLRVTGVKICSGLKPLCTNNTSSVVNIYKECDILRANRFTKFFPLNFDSENPQVELHFQKLASAGYFINGNSAQLFRWNWRIAPQIICRQVVV